MTAYDLIEQYYSDRTTNRSKVLLMNHIVEGVEILHYLNADKDTIDAFCIHPLLQADRDLLNNYQLVVENDVNSKVILFAMEYRQRANSWLSDKVSIDESGNVVKIGSPDYGNLLEVKQMLIADKVQNYDDFLMYHAKTHPRAKELDFYFNEWLDKLDISESEFRKLANYAKGFNEDY